MNYDAIVIGFGQGANLLVNSLAAQDWNVALVEKNENNYGGSCINIGCIPTKLLEYDSRVGADYKEAVERRNSVVEDKRQGQKDSMVNNNYVDLYTGTASFVDNYKVKVETGVKTVELTSDRIMVSTGSGPIFPPVEGLESIENVYTSTTLQLEKELPKSLGIIGGGNIGLEFGSIYATYGSEVTIVDNDTFMNGEESEISDEVKRVLEGKGIELHNGISIEKVKNNGEKVVAITNNNQEFTFDALLVATGRRPHISSLNLDNTDITLNENNGIKVNNHLQTDVDGVYAFGDVKGENQFTYITLKDAEIIVSDVLEDGEKTLDKRQNVPYSIFMDPSFARVGLTEKQAQEQGYNIATNTVAVSSMVRAAVTGDDRGLWKSVVDKDSNKILGVSLFGDQSHELINFIKMAMDNNLPYTVFRDQMMTHPVMAENLNTLFAV